MYSIGHGEDAALALNPFEDNAGGAFADHLFERHFVVGRDEMRAGKQRLKIAPVFFLAGDGKSAEGAPMKGIVQRDDLVLLRD